LKYGIKLQVAGVAGLFNLSLDKLLISHFLRIDLVTFYELGARVSIFIRSIPMLLLSPLVPATSELHSRHDKDRLRALYFRGSKYMILVTAPLAFFIGTMAPTIMLIWLGTDNNYRYSILAMRILAVGHFFNMLPGIVTPIVRGIGILKYEMWTCSFIALANLVLSLVLIVKIGFIGALVGTSSSMIMGYSFYLYVFNRYMKESFMKFLRTIFLKPVTAAIMGSAVILLVQHLVLDNIIQIYSSRVYYLAFLCVQGLIFCTIYIGTLVLSKYITKSEFTLLKDAVKSLR